ncbi:GTP pyrophosphokinase family protein [Robertmurraya korlensis]|uniref:GTP pyrophosphokinase n=1 Tax=Robertmurraya korlensis TaxID=519977 RepID=UPI00203E5CFB|nr:GTP pyrophosphokinase family protein [Robertmurraya korlensis]MCM3600802.1 GTP pyrophosphokinase family protein [Robertmurraya korlensis]
MSSNQVLDLKLLKKFKNELTRFMMLYQFGIDELNTKIDILKQEFQYIHDYSPIEHVKSRIKSPESILKKVQRKNIDLSLPSIKENIKDIAGIRITCSFISDIFEISRMLENQSDIEVVEKKDYINHPKPNGYQSLHLIVKIPVFMSNGIENVYVEVQIRTIGMDFWASLEHKIYYKFDNEVPAYLSKELKNAADTVAMLDKKMEVLHEEIRKLDSDDDDIENELNLLNASGQKLNIPRALLESLSHVKE